MKILITGTASANGYLEEVLNYSKMDYTYGELGDVNEQIQVILFQWPEELVRWSYPSSTILDELEQQILTLKKRCKLVGIIHNLKPHVYKGINHDRLFNLVNDNLDDFVHFGNFSKSYFETLYPNANHVYLNHSLYRNTLPKFKMDEARKELKVKEDKKIIIVPGKVRTKKEQALIFKAARILKSKGVHLVVLRMKKELISDNFKGYYMLKKIFNFSKMNKVWFNYKTRDLNTTFFSERLSNRSLALWLSASNAVWIARDNILNSGVFYLSLTYGKPILGPNSGNINEHLVNVNGVVFNSTESEHLKGSFDDLISVMNNWKAKNLEQYEPENIAIQFDQLLIDSCQT